jgi:tetratricopeptide (TPR) repeat protein
LAIKPDHANAIERLGLALFRMKRYGEAANAFDQLKTYKPNDTTYNYLGESLFEDGRSEQSVDAFNNAVAINPDSEKARYNLGRAYLKIGNREMAMVQLEILRNSKSDWADRLYVLLNP